MSRKLKIPVQGILKLTGSVLTETIPFGIFLIMKSRERILEAALDLFSQRSYEGCGTQEICRESGLTKPSLYHHFGSKRGLLDALVNEITCGMVRLLAEIEYHHNLPLTLTNLTRGFFSLAETERTGFRYFTTLRLSPLSSESRESIEAVDELITQRITEIFTAASEDHGNMRGRELLLTTGFLAMIITFGILIADGKLSVSDQLVTESVRMFSHGIYS